MESGPGSRRNTRRRKYNPYPSAMTLLQSTIHNRMVSRGPNCGKEIVASLMSPPNYLVPVLGPQPGRCSFFPFYLQAAWDGHVDVKPVHRHREPFAERRADGLCCPVQGP